ncbi:MAG: hypothetical protein NTZ67_02925 [Gammaproteobacteria bacterium]|nr:hypothetical protein [Gammaproteobacteria bacterium]
MRKVTSVLASSAVLFCLMTSQSFAATTATNSMHYGKQTAILKSGSTDAPIVITNYTYQADNVTATFIDGSSKSMTIFPVSNPPYNVISIGDSSPFVLIEIDALDGTPLFGPQDVYPGQQVSIGFNAKHTTAVTLSAR